MNHLLWLIPVLPLAGFLVNALVRLPRGAAALVGCAGPAFSFILSVAALAACPVEQRIFSWITVGAWSIPFGLSVDPLGAVMILVVTGVGSIIHVYSVGYMKDDEGFSRYFAYLNLFMFSMLVLVMADSLPLLFVGWEGVGLCSYLLIGFWYKDLKNADAGMKAFITNRVGDVGFLLGMFVLWQMWGTLDFGEMAARSGNGHRWAAAAGLLLFLGACGKSAQIPLHVWLPDAMAGPTPVSALIHAATMVTAGVYMMARMRFLYATIPGVLEVVGAVAAATALLAAVTAVAQNDIKKILAYSTISQLGFMFAGIATAQFSCGIFHLVTHAFFKALLFLGAGAVIHALGGEQDIRKMGGLAAGPLRLVFVTFAVGALALSGFGPFSGFYSKDLILAAALGQGKLIFWVLVATAGLTTFYSMRLVILVFLVPAEREHHIHKPDLFMTLPLVALAVLSALGGAIPVEAWLWPVQVSEAQHHAALKASWIAFAAGFLGAVVAFLFGRGWVKRFVEGPGRLLHRLAVNKFYADEIYELAVLAPVRTGAALVWYVVDRIVIDRGLVHGTVQATLAGAEILRRPHTGSINMGLAVFTAGAVAALAYLLARFL